MRVSIVCVYVGTYVHSSWGISIHGVDSTHGVYVCMHSQEGDKNKHFFFSPEASAAIPTHTKT